ncbi:hypothetical protein L1987_86858 [Smallanthus sonchifolius]|uniref:Uncharacterized protein n=1 Tax=Smallanthus sonchifolius TaxID=185202 RepID=A0ACB8Y0G4_9ASTR|nr:hypothetical protein L1987_86858 [Smallanthus sonchifolius]
MDARTVHFLYFTLSPFHNQSLHFIPLYPNLRPPFKFHRKFLHLTHKTKFLASGESNLEFCSSIAAIQTFNRLKSSVFASIEFNQSDRRKNIVVRL